MKHTQRITTTYCIALHSQRTSPNSYETAVCASQNNSRRDSWFLIHKCSVTLRFLTWFILLGFCCILTRTRAVQPVATCRQAPYLRKPATVIVTSSWRHSLLSWSRTYVRTDTLPRLIYRDVLFNPHRVKWSGQRASKDPGSILTTSSYISHCWHQQWHLVKNAQCS